MDNVGQICRVCLSVNVKMYTLKNTNIDNLYKLLTQTYVDGEDGKPSTVCFLCYARLRQCVRLQQQAIKSNELLKQLLKDGIMETTANAILSNQYSSQNLQVSSTYCLDLEPTNFEEVLLERKVKVESLVSVKEELEEAIDERHDVSENLCMMQPAKEVKNEHYSFNSTEMQQNDQTYNNEEAYEAIAEEFNGDINKCGKQFAAEDIVTDHILECIKTEHVVSDNQTMIADTLKSLPSKIYSCNICTFGTNQKRLLDTHLKMHKVTKFLSCNICDYRCPSEYYLKRHMKKHTGKKPFPCNIREYRSKQKETTANAILSNQYSSQNLQVSSTYYLDLEPTNCVEVLLERKVKAESLISVKEELKEAIDEGHDVSENLCMTQPAIEVKNENYPPNSTEMQQNDQTSYNNEEANETIAEEFNGDSNKCGKQFANEDIVTDHIFKYIKTTENFVSDNQTMIADTLESFPSKIYTCNICTFGTNQKRLIEAHLKMHKVTKFLSCNICDYRCAREYYLKRHMKKHTDKKPFPCNIREYRSKQKVSLKQHIAHTGEKPFSCNICEGRFAKKNVLKRHMALHTGERPFSCNICGYKCALKFNLKKHIKTHTGEKPFSCNICEYRCTLKWNLQEHLKTHTGEKPFSCSFCEYKCAHKCTLKKHMSKHN